MACLVLDTQDGSLHLQPRVTGSTLSGVTVLYYTVHQCRRNWEKTGTVALRDLKLGPELPAPDIFEGLGGCGTPPPGHQQQPQQQQQQQRGGGTHAAFSCSSVSGSSRGIRLVDCSHNQLQRLPPSCGALTGLVRPPYLASLPASCLSPAVCSFVRPCCKPAHAAGDAAARPQSAP